MFAKVVVNNNGASEVTAQCGLLLGGATIDNGFLGVFLGVPPSDRELLSYSGTGTLSTAGTADLVCKVTGNEGNYFNRVITATQVGSLG